MESTKTLSLRVHSKDYDEIILECESKGITKSEWLERKIALAKNVKNIQQEILKRLDEIDPSVESGRILTRAQIISLRKLVRGMA